MNRIKFPIIIQTRSHYFQLWRKKYIQIGTATLVRTEDSDLIETWTLENLDIDQKFMPLIKDNKKDLK